MSRWVFQARDLVYLPDKMGFMAQQSPLFVVSRASDDFNVSCRSLRTGGQFAGIAQSVRPQQQRRNRNFGPVPPAQFHEQGDTRARVVSKAGSTTGCDRIHDEAGGSVHRRDHHQAASKGSSRNRTQTQTHHPGVRRVSHGLTNHPEQDATTKVEGCCCEDAGQKKYEYVCCEVLFVVASDVVVCAVE